MRAVVASLEQVRAPKNHSVRKANGRPMTASYLARTALCLGLILPVAGTSGLADTVAALKQSYVRPVQIPFPKERPFTLQKAALGKALFFDSRLSGAENMNCASCHN